MKIRTKYTCPLELVHDMVKGKWKPIIIFQFRNGKSYAGYPLKIEYFLTARGEKIQAVYFAKKS